MPVKAKKLFPKCSACSALSPTLLLAAQWHLEAAQTCSNGRVAIKERTSSVSSLLDHDSNRDIPWSFLYCKSIICWNLAPLCHPLHDHMNWCNCHWLPFWEALPSQWMLMVYVLKLLTWLFLVSNGLGRSLSSLAMSFCICTISSSFCISFLRSCTDAPLIPTDTSRSTTATVFWVQERSAKLAIPTVYAYKESSNIRFANFGDNTSRKPLPFLSTGKSSAPSQQTCAQKSHCSTASEKWVCAKSLIPFCSHKIAGI